LAIAPSGGSAQAWFAQAIMLTQPRVDDLQEEAGTIKSTSMSAKEESK
jgi:hypothetical protein